MCCHHHDNPLCADARSCLLRFAARAQHLNAADQPQRAVAEVVISDVLPDATYAYSGWRTWHLPHERIARWKPGLAGFDLRPDLHADFRIVTVDVGRPGAGAQ